MRECHFILPANVPGQKHFHTILRKSLTTWFGGYTATACYGGWTDDNGQLIEEENVRYTVATKSLGDQKRLVEIATIAASEAKQQCLYFVGGHGVVNLIEIEGSE